MNPHASVLAKGVVVIYVIFTNPADEPFFVQKLTEALEVLPPGPPKWAHPDKKTFGYFFISEEPIRSNQFSNNRMFCRIFGIEEQFTDRAWDGEIPKGTPRTTNAHVEKLRKWVTEAFFHQDSGELQKNSHRNLKASTSVKSPLTFASENLKEPKRKRSFLAHPKTLSKSLEKNPKVVSEVVTTPQSIHKARHQKGIEYYNKVAYTPSGEMILNGRINKETISISRSTCNFSGAWPYLFDVIFYVCTHKKENITKTENYYSVTIPYQTLLDLALDGYTEQTRYLQNEFYRITQSAQHKLIAINENVTLYAPPSIVAFKFGDRPLSEKGKRGARQLKKEIHAEVEILFLQCLFRDLVEENSRYSVIPKGFFSKLKAIENSFKDQHILEGSNTEGIKFVDQKDIRQYALAQTTQSIELNYLTSQVTAEIANKLFSYFRLHDNSTSKEIRKLRTIDVLKHCVPQYVRTLKSKTGEYIDYYNRGAQEFLKLMQAALNEVYCPEIARRTPKGRATRGLVTSIELADDENMIVHYGNRY